ncbi:hypothetical protein [Micromonospora sp. NPDC048830]|uniref:hypothetical protein n=1 Tax=Micromonospora sp. NPDC048830 TaxID=3364257 RepID=UPI003710519C
MPEPHRLAEHHAPALLRFERENRAYFARSVPDRGDAYFAGFAARHAALLAEQAAGLCHMASPVGEVLLSGKPGLRHVRDLVPGESPG